MRPSVPYGHAATNIERLAGDEARPAVEQE